MSSPNRTLIPDITRLLIPLMESEENREFSLEQAFYYTDQRIYQQIDRTGGAKLFTSRCIKSLWDIGCRPGQIHPLSMLLETVKDDCSEEQQRQITAWIAALNDLCAEPPPIEPPASTPVPVSPVSAVLPADLSKIAPIQTIDTPMEKRTPTVFFSYSHADTEFAQKLITDLQRAGHSIWVDISKLQGGDQWLRAIAEGIINSYVFILLATKESLNSQWVQDEILWARQRNKQIIPLLKEDVTHETEFFPLIRIQGIKFYELDYATGLQNLLIGIGKPRLEGIEMLPADLPRHITQRDLELQYLERLNLENWLTTIKSIEQYQQMAGVAQTVNSSLLMTQKFRFLGDLFGDEPPEAAREQREYSDIIQAINEIKRAVLLGEPGAGKTTTLWRLAKDLFDTAMFDPKASIPVLVRLGKWTDATEPLTSFIRRELGRLGDYLENLIAEKRVVLLLDGLNEIPLAQRKAGKDEQVKTFIESAYQANPELIGVISCRARDYLHDRDWDWSKIEVAPLDPIRIREFAMRYLDPVKMGSGETMFWQLAGGEDLKAVWYKWKQAGASLDLFFSAPQVPQENPPVYHATTRLDNDLWYKKVRTTNTLLRLAHNPYMLTMMTNIYRETGTLPNNRGALFSQFIDELIKREARTNRERMVGRETKLMAALAKLAYAMQIRRDVNAKGNSTASTALPIAEVRPALLDEELLYLAGSTSILSVGEAVRFSHQLLQEYFAALYMMLEIRAGRLKASDLWNPINWWEPTGWEEATILLVGIFPEQIQWVAAANPELAAQCIVRNGSDLKTEILETFRIDWINRLSDMTRDPDFHSRTAIGRALGLIDLDDRHGVGVLPNRLPDFDWCEVPGGEFIYQKNQKRSLPTFYISKYLVTYRQFQVFIDAADGFSNPVWWAGLHEEGLQQQSQGPGDQEFTFWNHPREQVSWYDAMAYCRWVSAKLGQEIILPTEEQWEKAARGTDGRVYPYEGEFDLNKNNTAESKINQTSAVGVFPNGASPYGVLDMAGNVWEWALTERHSTDNNLDPNDTDSNNLREVRGGSWYHIKKDAQATHSQYNRPDVRNKRIGFRLAYWDHN